MSKISNLIRRYGLAGLLIMFLACPVSASQLLWQSSSQILAPGQIWQLDLNLSVAEQSINAVAATVTYPSYFLDLVDISDGNSIIALWLDKIEEQGSFSFSGVIPGGFSGILNPQYQAPQPGKIVSLIFKVKEQEGQGRIDLEKVEVLLHDGLGTSDQVVLNSYDFTINQEAAKKLEMPSQDLWPEDMRGPEDFNLNLARDPNLFDGQWVLIFATQDKISGLDHYEVKEGKNEFITATSPYLLQDQTLSQDIEIKAVDRAGNETIAKMPAQMPGLGYEKYLIWVIMLLVLVIIVGSIKFIIDRKKYAGRWK